MRYAHVTAGKVVNVVEAASLELASSVGTFDAVVRIDALSPEPGVDWDYDAGTGTFTDNRA